MVGSDLKMRKVYKKLFDNQIKRGVIFCSTLSKSRTEEYGDTSHEVLNTDTDKEDQIRRLKDDRFFNGSSFKFNIIRT